MFFTILGFEFFIAFYYFTLPVQGQTVVEDWHIFRVLTRERFILDLWLILVCGPSIFFIHFLTTSSAYPTCEKSQPTLAFVAVLNQRVTAYLAQVENKHLQMKTDAWK